MALMLAVALTLGIGFGARRSLRGTSRKESIWSVEDAHNPAGVVTSSLGPVRTSFHQRLESMKAELAEDPNDVALTLELARLLHDGHRLAEAIEHYRTAIDLNPARPEPYYDLASAYADQGRWGEAGDILRERLELAPGDPTAMYDLGAALANVGDAAGARVWWTRVLESTSDPETRSRAQRALEQIGGLDPP